MSYSSSKLKHVLGWLAARHAIHTILIAVATLGAVLPAARSKAAPAAVRADAAQPDAANRALNDKDDTQSQDSDSDGDQAQDCDSSEFTKPCVVADIDEDDYLAPKLILIVARRVASQVRRRHAARPRLAPTAAPPAAPRPVYARMCRLML